jgi:hypothetical protein
MIFLGFANGTIPFTNETEINLNLSGENYGSLRIPYPNFTPNLSLSLNEYDCFWCCFNTRGLYNVLAPNE